MTRRVRKPESEPKKKPVDPWEYVRRKNREQARQENRRKQELQYLVFYWARGMEPELASKTPGFTMDGWHIEIGDLKSCIDAKSALESADEVIDMYVDMDLCSLISTERLEARRRMWQAYIRSGRCVNEVLFVEGIPKNVHIQICCIRPNEKPQERIFVDTGYTKEVPCQPNQQPKQPRRPTRNAFGAAR
jgi:hypothetical protein